MIKKRIAEGFTSSMDVWDWIMAGYKNPKEAKFYRGLGMEAYNVDKITLSLMTRTRTLANSFVS